MSWLLMIIREWKLVAAALVAGAIIHIVATLHGADIVQSRAYANLTRDLPSNQVVFAAPVTPENQPIPFFAPGSLYSYCHYDASTARIGLTVKLPEAGWSLSLYSPKGENFYYVAGTDARETDVKLVLVPPGNVFVDAALANAPGAGPVIPEVRLPAAEGLAILRAPIKGFAYQRRADERRGSFQCAALQ
jgi:uncharacterized membrane protein